MPVVRDTNRKANEQEPREPSASDEAELARDGARLLFAPDSPRNIALRALLSSARHELGSPLQSIQGFAELLESGAYGALSEEQHSFLGHILTASGELQNVMDACLELAELELIGRTQTAQRLDVRSALVEALEHVQRRRGIVCVLQAGPPVVLQRIRIDRDLFRRALETLLVALCVRDGKSFTVAIDAAGEYARVTVARTGRAARTQTLPLEELARASRITRNLVWFRLAAALFATQDATLSLAEQLDCAEVRIRLSSTH